jgi:hypothetical protein
LTLCWVHPRSLVGRRPQQIDLLAAVAHARRFVDMPAAEGIRNLLR